MTQPTVDISEYSCGPDVPVREVLKRIDQSPHLFQIIVAADGKLLGTVTDGDIRRAMLQDVGLDAPIRTCMRSDPVVGFVGNDDENSRRLRSLGSSRAFLPIIDRDGILKEICVMRRLRESHISTALVMAGGLGRRLAPRTQFTPKPLLPLGGKPILEHVLARLEEANVEEIYISVHYLADQIRSFIAQRGNRASVHILTEEEPRGTAGALSELSLATDAPILVVNGDVITKVDFAKLHDFHFRHGHDGTIGVARHDIEIAYGVVRVGKDGLFTGIDEKPRISNFIAAGLYFLAPEFINLVPKDQNMDMPELLNLGQSMGLKIGLFPIHEYWIDVGHPHDLAAAETELGELHKDAG